MSEKYTVAIKKRPFYEWLLWVIWFFGVIFIFQNALASGGELEPRASSILWVSFVVWLLAGVVVWFTRRDK